MKKAILQIFTAILALGLFCGAATAAPFANFTVNKTQGTAPLTVHFTDHSQNATSWNWNFGDNNIYAAQNPPDHTYNTAGNYPVTLTVQNSTDGSSNSTIPQFINVLAPELNADLNADFDATPPQGSIPLTVQFTDKSTNASEWNWDFGDGTNSTEKNPKHIYSTVGTFNVTLRATINNGAVGIVKQQTKSIEAKAADNSTGNRIWDESQNMTTESYTWNAQSFSGFYYDLDSGVSSESMTIKKIGRSINSGDIEYVTKPAVTKFKYSQWGNYTVIGFMADKYFAGYTDDSVPVQDNISPISNGILSKILIDSNDKKSMTSGQALALDEGYSMSIKEVNVNGDQVWIQLEKDGKVVDDEFIASGKDLVYKTDLGKATDVPIIIVHFGTVFHSSENDAVFLQGIFQISGNYVEVKDSDDFGEMEVKSISSDEINMENKNDVGLSRGDTVDLMGNIKIQVADDSKLRFAPVVDTSQTGTYELRGTVYDRSINGDITEGSPFSWTPLNFEGFYYNIDEGIGTESLKVEKLNGNTIPSDNLVYLSQPQAVNFKHKDWDNFTVVGFMGDKYFAGYPDGAVNGAVDRVSVLSNSILSKILTDSDDKASMSQGSALPLQEGYSLNIKEVNVNGDQVWVQLEKDGKVVDDGFVSSDKDYVYTTDIGKATKVPLIIVHFGSVFNGAETSAVFVQGIFQISDEYKEIKNGDTFDKMEITDVSDQGITMKNSDDIGLSRGENTTVMNNVSFKTADNSTLRFYPYVEVQSGGSAHGLNIGVPDDIAAGSAFDITITADGKPVEGVNVKVNGNGTDNTSADGTIQYTAANAGTLKLTAEKTGYSTASRNVNVTPPKDEMSLSVSPERVYIGDNITITALKKIGGDPIVGANISINGQVLGATGSDGNISYKTDKNGTIKVSAIKKGFNNNSIDVKVRDLEPIFEVSNLTVKPMVVDVGKNVTINATIVNTGNAAGNYTAVLIINNNTTNESKGVHVEVGGNESVTFEHREETPNNYTVLLQGQPPEQGVTYTVKAGSSILLYALIVVVLLVIGGAAYYFTKGGGDVGALQEKVQELVSSIKLKK